MITISEDNYTHGIVKVTVFADTYTEMMQLYQSVPDSYYNVRLYKKTLRYGPNHFGRKQWLGFYTRTVRK